MALGDSGADESAIPRELLQDGNVQYQRSYEKLYKPLKVRTVTPDHPCLTAVGRGKFNITISLPCGPLRLRKVPFLVVEDKMDEVILGRPLLKSLGFDLDEHLEKVRRQLGSTSLDPNEQVIQSTSESSDLRIASYKGLWYNDLETDPVPPLDTGTAKMGIDKPEEIDKAFDTILTNAKDAGLTENGLRRGRELLQRHRDVFRIKLGDENPAKVAPMQISLKPNAKPVKAVQRRYTPKQACFINSTVKKLEELGIVRKNPTAKWASPALAVPKPGSEEFRFAVDVRAVNEQTEPMVSAMPDMEGLILSTAGSRVYCEVDFCHSYWQFLLHHTSQECMSIQTPLGIFTPYRIIQGGTDSGNHFQAATSPLFASIDKLIQWLDEFLLFAADEAELLDNVENFLKICEEYGLKVHAEKFKLFPPQQSFAAASLTKKGFVFILVMWTHYSTCDGLNLRQICNNLYAQVIG